jgi:hypothetical protein
MYDIFYISNHDDDINWLTVKERYPTAQRLGNITSFDQIRSKAFTKMFWVIWDNAEVSNFNLHSYQATKWDEQYVHVFKNGDYFDGICLFSKNKVVTIKEFNHRFFTNKKEIDIVASTPKPFDIVFISYHELNSEENYKNLLIRYPNAKRVDGVKGIHQAHIEAAKQVSTEMFYVVDGDAQIMNEFTFDYQIPYYDINAKRTVYVWQSQNPINGLTYGYGGVKLLPTVLTINMDLTKPDMTTSISKLFRPMPTVSNITVFNTDPYNSWRSAFRECVKLSSKTIDRQNDDETTNRLDVWCTVGADQDVLRGAQEGRAYGLANKDKPEALKMINDFDWLKARFNGR